MFLYQIKIGIRRYKTDEFVKSMRSYARNFRKEKGCLGYSIYRDFEKEKTFSLVGEWDTRQTMETHFKTLNFEVLIGATKVLGETFEMNIGEVLKTDRIAAEGERSGGLTISRNSSSVHLTFRA